MPYSFNSIDDFQQKLVRQGKVLYFDNQPICELHPQDEYLVDQIKSVKPSTALIIYLHTLAHSLLKYKEKRAQDFGEFLLTFANELMRARKQAMKVVKKHLPLLE